MATVVLAYPYDQAVEVLDGVSRWMVDAPRTIGGGAFLAQPDAAPGNPAATSVLLASTGTAAELSAEVDRLVAGAGTPLSRQDGVQTYRDLMMVVFGCVTMTQAQCHRSGKSDQGQLDRPVYGVERTRLGATPLPTGGWDQVVSAATATDEARAAARRWVGRGFATADPYSIGESYQNWMDPALPDWKASYYAENYPRLARVKAAYDPHRFFAFAQGIGAGD